MSMRPALLSAVLLAATLLVSGASATPDEFDYYVSLPGAQPSGGIYRLDADTLQLTPFAVGMGIPFYGVWATDGFLYIPDRAFGVIYRISDTGTITPWAGGGFLQTPVTVAQGPDGAIVASDIIAETVVRLDAAGNQTLLHDKASAGDLIHGPGGLGFGPDGTLYVSNNTNNSIAAIAPDNSISLVVQDPMLDQPGGIAVDGAGNLFVSSYGSHRILRVRLATGELEVFCDDPFMNRPNDVKLHHDGSLAVTVRNHALVSIDALGQLTVVFQDVTAASGEWDGVAVQADHPPCDGAFVPYGAGTAGTGGVVPELGGIFAPCVGRKAALELRGFQPGAFGFLLWGLGAGAIPAEGGVLLLDVGQPWNLIPLSYDGAGTRRLKFSMPDDPLIDGLSLYLQAVGSDAGAPAGWSFSQGVQERIGS